MKVVIANPICLLSSLPWVKRWGQGPSPGSMMLGLGWQVVPCVGQILACLGVSIHPSSLGTTRALCSITCSHPHHLHRQSFPTQTIL